MDVLYGKDIRTKFMGSRERMAGRRSADSVICPEALPNAQIELHRQGYREAVIKETAYGYSLRYVSGLCNFGIIISSRARPRTLSEIRCESVEWAKENDGFRVVLDPYHGEKE